MLNFMKYLQFSEDFMLLWTNLNHVRGVQPGRPGLVWPWHRLCPTRRSSWVPSASSGKNISSHKAREFNLMKSFLIMFQYVLQMSHLRKCFLLSCPCKNHHEVSLCQLNISWLVAIMILNTMSGQPKQNYFDYPSLCWNCKMMHKMGLHFELWGVGILMGEEDVTLHAMH